MAFTNFTALLRPLCARLDCQPPTKITNRKQRTHTQNTQVSLQNTKNKISYESGNVVHLIASDLSCSRALPPSYPLALSVSRSHPHSFVLSFFFFLSFSISSTLSLRYSFALSPLLVRACSCARSRARARTRSLALSRTLFPAFSRSLSNPTPSPPHTIPSLTHPTDPSPLSLSVHANIPHNLARRYRTLAWQCG